MTAPLGAVAFLSRSENRIQALVALADRPFVRNELATEIGVSRVTAQRILNDLVRHGWVTVDGRTYRVTELGRIVSEEFQSLLETIAAVQQLATIDPWLPAEFDVDRRHLYDARITVPTPGDPIAPVRHSIDLMRAAVTIRGLAAGIAPEAVRINRDCVVDGGQSFEVVFSGGVLDVVADDPQMSTWMRELLDAGGTVYRHETLTLLVGEFDGECLGLGVMDEPGVPQGFLECCHEDVLNWFDSTFERYRDASTRVDAETFPL